MLNKFLVIVLVTLLAVAAPSPLWAVTTAGDSNKLVESKNLVSPSSAEFDQAVAHSEASTPVNDVADFIQKRALSHKSALQENTPLALEVSDNSKGVRLDAVGGNSQGFLPPGLDTGVTE